MDKQIINAQLKFNCCTNWDEMETAVGGRNCQLCQKKVFDLTNSNQNDLDKILAANNYNICARFTAEQAKVQPVIIPFWKKWVSAAMVLIGFNLLNSKAVAQNLPIKTDTGYWSKPMVMGEVVIMGVNKPPIFPGGVEALNSFLNRELSYKGTDGQVVVSFNIDPLGNVKKAKILTGLDRASNKEALRVINLSPKWIPATDKGKQISKTVTLPMVFKR